jgi:hypothetical protein
MQRDVTFGCESCGGASQFSGIFDVAVSARGEILVADRDAPMLRLFDAAGKAVWSGGTSGRGPGEYQLVIRSAFLPSGGLVIVDMTAQRVTELAADHSVVSTTLLPRFPTTAGADFAGIVLIGAEGPRGSLDLVRWSAGAVTPVAVPLADNPNVNMMPRNSSVALSPSGVIAVFINNEQYVIARVDSSGARLGDLTRAVERVRRTNKEEADLRGQLAKGTGMVAAEAKSRRVSGARPAPAFPVAERTLKPHVTVDALRYDPSGRLWVRTMRGDLSNTVFDVFASNGAFIGAVAVPAVVQAYALCGNYLVTGGASVDGIPQVTRWIIR